MKLVVTRHRCMGIRPDGKRCRKPAKKYAGRCWQHPSLSTRALQIRCPLRGCNAAPGEACDLNARNPSRTKRYGRPHAPTYNHVQRMHTKRRDGYLLRQRWADKK